MSYLDTHPIKMTCQTSQSFPGVEHVFRRKSKISRIKSLYLCLLQGFVGQCHTQQHGKKTV